MAVTIEDIKIYQEKAFQIEKASYRKAVKPEVKKDPPYFSTTFVAGLLGMSRNSLYPLISEGDIPFKIFGKNTKKLSPEGISKLREFLENKNPVKYKRKKFKRGVCIGINSNKGGTGKTQTTYNLAGFLNLYAGLRVLMIDADSQGSLRNQSGLTGIIDPVSTSYACFTPYEEGFSKVEDCVLQTNWHGLDIIPSSLELYNVEFELPAETMNDKTFPFWKVFAERIEPLRKQYDVILVDSPPSLSFVSMNIAFASDGLIMPVISSQPSFYSLISYLKMLSDNMATINEYAQEVGQETKDFKFLKVVANIYEDSKPSREIIRKLQMTFGENMMMTPVLKSASVEQAANEYKNVYEINPKSRDTHERCLTSINSFGMEVMEVIDELYAEEFSLE